METATLQGYHDFVIKCDFEFADKFTTEGGLELYGDKRFLADRLANRIATVLHLPAKFDDSVIKPGYQVLIDPVFHRQNYETIGVQDNANTIDRHAGLYKIEPSLIILYRETPESEWKGYGDNLAVIFDKEIIPELKSGNLILKEAREVKSETIATVAYVNDSLEDVAIGDKIYVQGEFAVPFWIEEKEYIWINNRHVLAKID